MYKVAVLITSHNRRETTLRCLEMLLSCDVSQVELSVVLVDDGSSDGTSRAVAERFPSVRILEGDGSLYWNRGTFKAFGYAKERGFDAYIWLNDDTMLYKGALQDAMAISIQYDHKAIIVGAIQDPATGEWTYGGALRPRPHLRPFRIERVMPTGAPEQVDVINGNFVWIPSSVAGKLGNLDPVFEHAMGDTDYALRAGKAGIQIYQTGRFIGQCSRNGTAGTYFDARLSWRERTRLIFSRKGFPLKPWLVMCVRHGGVLWPLHFVRPYVKIFRF